MFFIWNTYVDIFFFWNTYVSYVVRRTSPQVIRDDRQTSGHAGATVGAVTTVARRDAIKGFLQPAGYRAKNPEDAARLSQKICALGLHHALEVACGWGLEVFRPRRRAVPLGPSETRYYVRHDALPPHTTKLGQVCRSCVSTGSLTGFELNQEGTEEPRLPDMD